MWKMSLPDLDHEIKTPLSFPPAFAIASPSLDRGEAMAKVGGRIPLVEPELSPVPCFVAGNSAGIAAFVCTIAGGGLPSRFGHSRLKQF
jgi:hypothetical protein